MAANDDNVIIEPAPFTRAESGAKGPRFKLKPVPIALGLLFLILAIAVAFMLGARAVRFNIEPAPESFEITSGWITWRVGERFLMWPGDYGIHATHKGYEDLITVVGVNEDQDQDIDLAMVKLPGILTITTTPQVPAQVLVDQQPKGTTPVTLAAIPAGIVDVRLVSERYLPFDTEIEIEGMGIEQSLDAELTPAWANITITSLPDQALVLVDGEQAGTTPAVIEILEGARQIELRKQGYKTWQTSLDVAAGQDQSLSLARLLRSDGMISVMTTPEGANVTIGGRYRGQTPLEVALPPDASYEVLLSKAGYQPVERTIKVEAEADVALNAVLQPVLGVLRLMVTPAGAELLVNGESVGSPPERLELTASTHRIDIIKEGYATFTTTVNPRPGLSQQLLVQLQTEDEARVAAIKETITVGDDIQLRLILPGTLKMGAGRREPGRRSNEIEKDVELTRAFYLGTKEITNAQFKQYAPNHDSGILGRSLLTDDDRPAVNVSWQDAVAFCNWLSQQEGLPQAYEQDQGRWVLVSPANTGYRLPTEAEWAWAARYADGPEPTRFPWGNAMPPDTVSANYADESAQSMVPYYIEGYNDTYRGPSPVGVFPANPFGIFDLAGNVSEWIHDYYSIDIPADTLVDPVGPEKGEYHVVRGSNYTHGRFSELRWTYRDFGAAPRADVGFRIARYVD